MSGELFVGLLVGAFVSFVISSVFAGAKFAELWKQLQEEKLKVAKLEGLLIEARDNMPIREWDDQWVVPVREVEKREHLYDKYPELVQPGTEVIVIDDLDDIPDA